MFDYLDIVNIIILIILAVFLYINRNKNKTGFIINGILFILCFLLVILGFIY